MRLLNTWTGEFVWHNDPKKVRYAILSHVWRSSEKGGEQSYDDVCRIQAAARAAQRGLFRFFPVDWPQLSHRDDTVPSDSLYTRTLDGVSVVFSARSPLSNKIKGLCKVAREAGFDLVWNDTCCIDKSSSAELSEAINSMYEWYCLSSMCYVYLADVPDDVIPSNDHHNPFRWSEWHTRGWTLQELLAAERIEFLSSSWRLLGTKLGLAVTLASITRIDIDILLGRARVDSASVAQRMSWAAQRKTTRVEDRAYSLMGLFGVHMSPIYGEGTNAFPRLQEEIIRTIPDQSVFAWGEPRLLQLVPCLLAPSPFFFLLSTVRPIARPEFASRLHLQAPEDVPPLDCVFAPQGVRIRWLCLNLTEVERHVQLIPWWATASCTDRASHRAADRLALLQCEDKDGRLVGLAFHSSDVLGDGRGSLIGNHCDCFGKRTPFRTIPLSRAVLAKVLERLKPQTTEVSVLRHCSGPPPSRLLRVLPSESLPPLGLWLEDRPDGVTFSISPDSIAILHTLGFIVSPLQLTREEGKITLETTLALRYGGPPRSTRLRLSLQRYEEPYEPENVAFRLSSAASPSPGFASSPGAPIDRTTQDSEVLGGDSEQMQRASTQHVERRDTLAQFDLIIHSCPQRPQRARLLRLSLERPPKGRRSAPNSSRAVFLVLGITEEYDLNAGASRVPSGSGDTTTQIADRGPSKHDIIPDAATTRCAALEEKMDASEGRQHSALGALVSPATSLEHAEANAEPAALASQPAALASQNPAVSTENAALVGSIGAILVSLVTAVWQRLLDAVAAAASE